MPPVIRKPEPSERGAICDLWRQSFPESSERFLAWYFSSVYREDHTFALFDGDELASNLQMIPYKIGLRGRPVAVETLSGVATAQAWRNRGYARDLMAHALADMGKRGLGYNFLYPFQHRFYERLGWSTCSLSLEPRLSPAELPDRPSGWTVERITSPDHTLLSTIYKRFLASLNCCCLRDDGQWQRRVEENAANGGFLLLATGNGPAQAYAFCEERADEVELVELAYTCLAAVDALLAAIKPIGKEVWWTAPEGDRFLMLRGAWKDRVRLQPHVMFRVVDVPLAFGQAAPACGGELVLEVSGDTMVPANNGVIRIVSAGGEVQAIRADGQPQFSCGIGTLARMLTGHMDATEALDAGVAHGDAGAAELLSRMYPRQRNFLFELY